ncbi:Serine carboxypeptidase [Chromobacterium violaceum]|uniref:Serine carboxypeptidase n=1 Tax=Chromobacterium violaceum TaxID=536 RepID=A0A447TGI6_CHRVL|nr:Serine carboxypeptidase [Chromobacterium violaceum]
MNVQSNPFLFESAALSHLPGFGAVRSTQLAGYLSVGDSAGGWLYFCFSEAGDHPEQAPLLVWINGAPEWSALDALLDEHGPYLLDPSGRVYSNPFGWHHHVNLLIIEQPLGHGLSFTTHPRYLPESHDEASLQLYHALQEFLLRWPRYRERDCYLFGNAAATHTIARLAHRVLDGNSGGQPQISLKGLGLGNASWRPTSSCQPYRLRVSAPADQSGRTEPRASRTGRVQPGPRLSHRLAAAIGGPDSGRDRALYPAMLRPRSARYPPSASEAVQSAERIPEKASVQQALHIDPRSNNELQPHSSLMTEAIWQESSSHLLPTLLDQLKVLFFHGECCMTGNYLGLDAWFNTQSWSQADAFRRKSGRPGALWPGRRPDPQPWQSQPDHHPERRLRVARDQPAAAQAMLRDFLAGDAPQ